MKTIVKFLVLLLIITISPSVFAERWVRVTSDFYADAQSFYKTGLNSAGMTFRVRNYMAPNGTYALGDYTKYRIDKVEANCENYTVKRILSTSYNDKFEVIKVERDSYYGPAVYGTLGGNYLEGICLTLREIDKI